MPFAVVLSHHLPVAVESYKEAKSDMTILSDAQRQTWAKVLAGAVLLGIPAHKRPTRGSSA